MRYAFLFLFLTSFLPPPLAINNASLLSVVLYVMVGGLGALTMPNVSENMLQTMMSGSFGTTTEICSEMFAFFIIGLGIPLFRYVEP